VRGGLGVCMRQDLTLQLNCQPSRPSILEFIPQRSCQLSYNGNERKARELDAASVYGYTRTLLANSR